VPHLLQPLLQGLILCFQQLQLLLWAPSAVRRVTVTALPVYGPVQHLDGCWLLSHAVLQWVVSSSTVAAASWRHACKPAPPGRVGVLVLRLFNKETCTRPGLTQRSPVVVSLPSKCVCNHDNSTADTARGKK
jgi:hypothetical protein